MSRGIQLNRKISVLPGNILIVPGTEPSTTITSTTLELEIRRAGRESPAIVDLNSALDLIPGSYVELLPNSGGPIQKFFVLPPQDIDCEANVVDYFEILRSGARPPSDEEKQMVTTCSSFDDYKHLLGS